MYSRRSDTRMKNFRTKNKNAKPKLNFIDKGDTTGDELSIAMYYSVIRGDVRSSYVCFLQRSIIYYKCRHKHTSRDIEV